MCPTNYQFILYIRDLITLYFNSVAIFHLLDTFHADGFFILPTAPVARVDIFQF